MNVIKKMALLVLGGFFCACGEKKADFEVLLTVPTDCTASWAEWEQRVTERVHFLGLKCQSVVVDTTARTLRVGILRGSDNANDPLHDPKIVKNILESSAQLEFWEAYAYADIGEVLLRAEVLGIGRFLQINNQTYNLPELGWARSAAACDSVLRTLAHPSVATLTPPHTRWVWSHRADENGQFGLYALSGGPNNGPVLADGDIDTATPKRVERGHWRIDIKFRPDADRTFAYLTRRLGEHQKPMAVTYDGRVVVAPTVRGPIEGGEMLVGADLTAADAYRMALRPLPCR
jgi:hypothetical protein